MVVMFRVDIWLGTREEQNDCFVCEIAFSLIPLGIQFNEKKYLNFVIIISTIYI